MLKDQLYDPNEQHLPLEEAIRRITSAFHHVRFDRERGDAIIREHYECMVANDTPELILHSQRALFGHAVWVSVSDDHDPVETIEFLLLDFSDVWIDHRTEADRARFRPIVHKLAKSLGYDTASHS